MDFHPIIVHFPIALLTLYCVLELIHRWTTQDFWKPMRAVLVVTGTIGAFIALQTGELAEGAFRGSPLRSVLELHSLLANVTTILFGVLSGAYVIDFFSRHHAWERIRFVPHTITTILDKTALIVLRTPLNYLLVIVAFSALSLVGALGGILVYGPDMDPVTKAVYWMFF